MESSGSGKSPNTSLSFRYNATNEELEELYNACENDPPTPRHDASPGLQSHSENASPKKTEKTPSIIDKYFKSIKSDKDKEDKTSDEPKMSSSAPKEVTASPMKEYLNRLGKKTASDNSEGKEVPNETWKIFHEFKYKIAQAVDDLKSRSNDEVKEKSVPRESSTSDSEENSAIKDLDQQSIGDTDNQVSSLDSSIQNLSEISQPVTAKANREFSQPTERNRKNSESTDDTHKNLDNSDSVDLTKDLLEDNSLLDVESGIEALEDVNIEAFGDITRTDGPGAMDEILTEAKNPPTPTHFGFQPPPNKTSVKSLKPDTKTYFFNFTMYLLTAVLILSYTLFPNSQVWNGFLLGLWFFCLASNTKQWLLDNYFSDWEEKSFFELKKNNVLPTTYMIPSVKEHRPMKKYEGWVNHYRMPDYDPYTYHINQTTTAFMKLEGCNLRISYTRTKIAKRALWDEKIENITFYQHRFYNLTGARVILLPKGLVNKRQWSKKYPICVILSDKEKIQVLEKEGNSERRASESIGSDKKKETEVESVETNTSPEKKRKFVWRKREKSSSLTEGETGKEGLRHRIVRKMHREKKTADSADQTEITEKEKPSEELTFHDASADDIKDEADIDENELSRIKEFLEEAETEASAEGAEGEWSVHVKESRDRHSHLYLFARTGRDKHEWYRRLVNCISEANGSTESSAADEKSTSETQADKDEIEMAAFRLSEKDTVSFAKGKNESQSEAVTFSYSQNIPRNDLNSCEKDFWPYLFKIIQSHSIPLKQTAEAAVMCQIDPSPPLKSKKKKNSKNSPVECACKPLPPEMTWLNTLLARMMFDMMRDPVTKHKLQCRVQRKLNTLKLPSFMSPLLVTELSLRGACPSVARVAGPTWDARGVWLDAEVRYDGGATIEVLTQINLMKLKEKNVTLEEQLQSMAETPLDDEETNPDANFISEKLLMKRKPAIFDSDVEDSAESSSDDDTPPLQPADSCDLMPPTDAQSPATDSASSKKKFLRMVDKIATNKYFQTVTDYKYIKRALEGLSNTDIKLQLELCALQGRLALNLPPPPHDRVWLGFRTNPQLVLKARPAFGARALRFSHITNWIEQKLSKEFEKVLVLPNMEDIQIDLMTPTPVDYE